MSSLEILSTFMTLVSLLGPTNTLLVLHIYLDGMVASGLKPKKLWLVTAWLMMSMLMPLAYTNIVLLLVASKMMTLETIVGLCTYISLMELNGDRKARSMLLMVLAVIIMAMP